MSTMNIFVRLHHKAVKSARKMSSFRSLCKQESAFIKDPWSFSKSVCSPKTHVLPLFNSDTCLLHFKSCFNSSNGPTYCSFPSWIKDVMPFPSSIKDFDMSPITPVMVKRTLHRMKSSSAPGDDKISYFHLKQLPSCHH